MTSKSIQRDSGSQNKKPDGWFSRRHQTRDAHVEAVERYRTRSERRPKQVWDESRSEWRKIARASA